MLRFYALTNHVLHLHNCWVMTFLRPNLCSMLISIIYGGIINTKYFRVNYFYLMAAHIIFFIELSQPIKIKIYYSVFDYFYVQYKENH